MLPKAMNIALQSHQLQWKWTRVLYEDPKNCHRNVRRTWKPVTRIFTWLHRLFIEKGLLNAHCRSFRLFSPAYLLTFEGDRVDNVRANQGGPPTTRKPRFYTNDSPDPPHFGVLGPLPMQKVAGHCHLRAA